MWLADESRAYRRAEVQKSECAIETCYRLTIGLYFRLVRLGRSIWRPSERVAGVDGSWG
jgi:hypothetical protein